METVTELQARVLASESGSGHDHGHINFQWVSEGGDWKKLVPRAKETKIQRE